MLQKKINELKEYFEKHKENFFPFFSFGIILYIWILRESYFYFRDIFAFLLFLFFLFIFSFYYLFLRKKEFQEFIEEAAEKEREVWEEIKKKEDKFHTEKIIKILSILTLVGLFIYIFYTQVGFDKIHLEILKKML